MHVYQTNKADNWKTKKFKQIRKKTNVKPNIFKDTQRTIVFYVAGNH